MCQRRRQRRPFDGSRRSSELGRASEGLSFPSPQSIRLRLRRQHGSLPPTLSAGKYGFLDQEGLEDRSSEVGIDHGASAHVIGFAEVLELADVTGDAESSSSLTSQAMLRTSPFSMKVESRSRGGSTGWRCFAGGL